jgi:hypothetical protein
MAHRNRICMVFLVIVCAWMLSGCATNGQTSSPKTATPNAAVNNETVKPTSTSAPVTTPASTSTSLPLATPKTTPTVPSTDANLSVEHVVVVIEENHSYRQIVGAKEAPYMNELIQKGALMTNSHAITHPSQPNYLALFSGSTQGIKDDSCGKTFSTANLASQFNQNNLSFTGYSEDLPKPGYSGCSSKGYARKHNPWVQFNNVSKDANQPLTVFPQDLNTLPTLSFVIPNHQDDMHDGTIGQADSWLQEHIQPYVTWAEKNHSLLIVTWDEDDNSKDNRIPTIFVGPMVKPGKYDEAINHYHVLRTIENLYHIAPIGESAKVEPIKNIWVK